MEQQVTQADGVPVDTTSVNVNNPVFAVLLTIDLTPFSISPQASTALKSVTTPKGQVNFSYPLKPANKDPNVAIGGARDMLTEALKVATMMNDQHTTYVCDQKTLMSMLYSVATKIVANIDAQCPLAPHEPLFSVEADLDLDGDDSVEPPSYVLRSDMVNCTYWVNHNAQLNSGAAHTLLNQPLVVLNLNMRIPALASDIYKGINSVRASLRSLATVYPNVDLMLGLKLTAEDLVEPQFSGVLNLVPDFTIYGNSRFMNENTDWEPPTPEAKSALLANADMLFLTIIEGSN
jgi:hypothetical protein